MKKFFFFIGLVIIGCLFSFLYYYERWKPLWSLESPKELYTVVPRHDDTLRVVMIGDSWVGMRTDVKNLEFQKILSEMIGKPVKLMTKGKGGEKSRGIYNLLFEDCTRKLMTEAPNYCVIFAGINDAASNRGTKQYVYHYRLILQFLIGNNIQPVVIEIPDINIWNVKKEKPIKDIVGDFIKSKMTHCSMYQIDDYREALYSMLAEENLLNQVVYVPIRDWNGNSGIKLNLFLEDQIHLNDLGYAKMDTCIAGYIARHYGN